MSACTLLGYRQENDPKGLAGKKGALGPHTVNMCVFGP